MPVKVSKAMRNNELRGPTAIDTDIIPSDSEHVFAQEALYQEAMMRYHCAILEMRTKLEVLSKDMTVRYRRNPIEFIESRLKKPSSIARKLKKMGLEVTVDNMTQHLSDIAGIRVLCAYIDDIYEIARMLARQKDVRIITVKDYIKVPKDNGYRSYHLIVEIPVYFSDKVRPVRCEIQIRTIAMDFWASLEHKIYYKYDTEVPAHLLQGLSDAAEQAGQLDATMEGLHIAIRGGQNAGRSVVAVPERTGQHAADRASAHDAPGQDAPAQQGKHAAPTTTEPIPLSEEQDRNPVVRRIA